MRAYIIRYNDPQHGSSFAEIVAATEADAREDFERRYPTLSIIGSHEKPTRQNLGGEVKRRISDGEMTVNHARALYGLDPHPSNEANTLYRRGTQ